MKALFRLLFPAFLFVFIAGFATAQRKFPPEKPADPFVILKDIPASPVKNQGNTGTCWCFSGTSLLETQFLSSGNKELDLSEMFTVRNIYLEKARNYLLRQGKTQFSQGGLGHDVIRSVAIYGAVPEDAYSGLVHKTFHDHSVLAGQLKSFLDSLLNKTSRPLDNDWVTAFNDILDENLGKVPDAFVYNSKKYTAKTFSRDVLAFDPGAYVNITSFTHHPYYESFVLEVPDNFSNGAYYNIPLHEMTELAFHALEKGYSVLWDADVSNDNFRQQSGLAILSDKDANPRFDPSGAEEPCDAGKRQRLFEGLETQDDHLMHITGLQKLSNGKRFFKVKNSWGTVGPHDGYILVSENYFALNTISLVVPRAAIPPALAAKLQLR